MVLMNTPLPENLASVLVVQYNAERYNSACYASLASAFEEVNWNGFAKFMYKSSFEEMEHAKRVFDYLAERQALIEVGVVERPPAFNGEDVLGNFRAALALEVVNTAKFNALARLALDMNDFLTFTELGWFLDEQTKSEAELVQIISDLEHAEDCKAAILAIDRELGAK